MDSTTSEDMDRFETALRQFGKIMKRAQTWQVITALARIDIDQSSAHILMVLAAHEPPRCRLHQLATQIGVEAPSVTRKVQQLEQAGLVLRQQDNQDKRAFDIEVTAEGKAVVKKLHQAHQQIIRQALDVWPAEERRQFVALFERFSQQLVDIYTDHRLSNTKISKGSKNG
jgi:DNA-binding MarR family transcriptional regulator